MTLSELHAMPKTEDVTTIDVGNHTVQVVEIT
jgi:hypothetical protein